ncbi:hypothetical protein V1512DRAFT_291326 [Lipomyces arxii]|uniref:uncharacterized protein n=1 Tax=Lipomyces arxii TaxID=56418 RepID=UPI0034CFDBED
MTDLFSSITSEIKSRLSSRSPGNTMETRDSDLTSKHKRKADDAFKTSESKRDANTPEPSSDNEIDELTDYTPTKGSTIVKRTARRFIKPRSVTNSSQDAESEDSFEELDALNQGTPTKRDRGGQRNYLVTRSEQTQAVPIKFFASEARKQSSEMQTPPSETPIKFFAATPRSESVSQKRGRGRPRKEPIVSKASERSDDESENLNVVVIAEEGSRISSIKLAEQKRGRGRPRKNPQVQSTSKEDTDTMSRESASRKRDRGTPLKDTISMTQDSADELANEESDHDEIVVARTLFSTPLKSNTPNEQKRGRGRPRKDLTQPADNTKKPIGNSIIVVQQSRGRGRPRKDSVPVLTAKSVSENNASESSASESSESESEDSDTDGSIRDSSDDEAGSMPRRTRVEAISRDTRLPKSVVIGSRPTGSSSDDELTSTPTKSVPQIPRIEIAIQQRRGPGRPRNDGTFPPMSAEVLQARRLPSTAPSETNPPRRRMGASPVFVERRGPGRPRKDGTFPSVLVHKRGRGRPRKDEQQVLLNEVKRMRGRPRMQDSIVVGQSPFFDDSDEEFTKSMNGFKQRANGTMYLTPSSTPSKFRTPTKSESRVRLSNVSITPVKARIFESPADSSPVTPYESARAKLHVSVIPEALPCRDQEFIEISTALESALVNEAGSCIYISGTPGTGKTATVRSVIKYLKQSQDFQFVEINGMKITQPTNAYSILWQAISDKQVANTHALRYLNEEFKYQNIMTRPVVVLMDELDQLVTKSQDVMYNFFNWPSIPNSKLIVVAIANIMDLPERTLSNKISSRLGLTRVQFAGYTHAQLQVIIENRLQGSKIVSPTAIEFACKKVASVTGDARRALDICRRAVELAEEEFVPDSPSGGDSVGMPRVEVKHVHRAIQESTSSPMFTFLPTLSTTSKLVLVALMKQAKVSGVAENTIDSVLDAFTYRLRHQDTLEQFDKGWFGPTDAIAAPERVKMSDYDSGTILLGTAARAGDGTVSRPRAFLQAVTELVESGVLFQQAGRGERNRKIRLNVSEAVIKSALKNDEEVKKLL